MTALLFSFVFIPVGALMLVLLECVAPGVRSALDARWVRRAVLANVGQVLIIALVGCLWQRVFHGPSLLHASSWPSVPAIGLTYLLSSFCFYWWHRVRHESTFWWRVAHQLHHSASRLEILTTFYKHPMEMSLDAVLGCLIVYGIMGCSPLEATLYTVLVSFGEMFYHWNVHTPRWVGVFFQRPESHRIHHQRERHTRNYSELPLWDYLFGTYTNPKQADRVLCGFPAGQEERLSDMLRGEAVDLRRGPERVFRPACFGCHRRLLCQHSEDRRT